MRVVIMNEKAKLYLGNIPKEISNEFSNYAKQHETKQSQLFIEIWNNFKKHYLAFDEQEQALIEQALSIVDKSFDEFVKKTVLKAVKRTIANKDLLSQEVDINKRNSYRAASLRVKEIVEEMMEQNDTAPNWYERKFLSKKAIADYAKVRKIKVKGAMSLNMSVIERYLNSYKAEIEEHHKKYNLSKDHNLKAYHHLLNVNKKVENDRIYN